jgi:hypothetical protein
MAEKREKEKPGRSVKKPLDTVAPVNSYPPPSENEAARIAESRARVLARRRPAQVVAEVTEGKVLRIDQPHDGDWYYRLQDAFGTQSNAFTEHALATLIHATKPSDEGKLPQSINAMLAVVDGIRPRDETEAMLACQMSATHSFAMTCLTRANQASHTPQIESAANLAIKLMRTYTTQLESLARVRRGGEQKVTVEHVHVHNGGQAIVGSVTNTGGGGGVGSFEGQPHASEPAAENLAALAIASGSPVWSENPKREPVPCGGGEGQGPVPDARRRGRERGAER